MNDGPYAGTFYEEVDKPKGGTGDRKADSEPLPFVDMSMWDDAPAPPRQWLVLDRIPQRQPTLISGEGAIGKSILLLQLLVSTALSQPWIESLWPKPGPTIYFGAEDEQEEIRRRLEPILEHHGRRFSDLIAAGFKLLAFAGKDAVLAELGPTGRVKPTKLLKLLDAEAVALQPSAIVIDPVSDAFLGDEIKRDQVRQFGSLMRKLAIDSNSAVVISAHPSLSGISSGSGLSGSTQWHNTVRARAYFRKPKAGEEDDDNDDMPDSGRRELHFFKNQYGPLAHHIELKWSNGLWLPPSVADGSNTDKQMEELFLTLLRRFTAQRRDVSAKQSPTYAPAKFAETPDAKLLRASSRALAAAMERLFAAGRIELVPDGPPSKRRSKLVERRSADTYQPPPAAAPAASKSEARSARAETASEAPAPSNAGKEGALAGVLTAWLATIGAGQRHTAEQAMAAALADDDEAGGTLKRALAAVAPHGNQLEHWLHEHSGIEVGQLILREAGTDGDGRTQWTLELRVARDKGSPSL